MKRADPLAAILDAGSPINGYRVRILPYNFGQFRIQLIDPRFPDIMSPGEGTIVREMCTYERSKANSVAVALMGARDPEEVAESYAQPYNCEGKGGRIRLDNVPGDRQ